MRQFSPPHLAALAVLFLAAPAAVLIARRGSERVTRIVYRNARRADPVRLDRRIRRRRPPGIWTVRYDLPLQLTDVISFTTAIALWTRSQRATELVYLWGLSASPQATVTPDLSWNYPSVFYFTYFTYHVVAVVAGVGLVFGCGLYPTPGAALRVFVGTLAWAAVAGAGDLLSGGNYMYLRAKPVHGSLLSDMGPWPWYLVATAALGLAMLLVLQGIANVVARHDPQARSQAAGATRAAAAHS